MNPLDELIQADLLDVFYDLFFEELDIREQAVLILRLGLDGHNGRTLDEVVGGNRSYP